MVASQVTLTQHRVATDADASKMPWQSMCILTTGGAKLHEQLCHLNSLYGKDGLDKSLALTAAYTFE